VVRPALEVADIFRDFGPAWRQTNAGHVSLGQLKVMSAIERCRTAALGGHVARCENENCGYTRIAYNSCRNRHCNKCQAAAAKQWLAERQAELLPVPYFHVVFTLPAAIADLAYQNKAAAHKAGQLQFFNQYAHLAERKAFARYLAPLRRRKWYVYSKRPFGGPEAVLAYLSRYTHRVAISNRRLIALDENGVTFNYKDYRANGRAHYKVMTLATSEFIRRFLSHVLPKGFHRIRYYGLLAKSSCAENLARARQLLAVPKPQVPTDNDGGPTEPSTTAHPCPCCGSRMIIIEAFAPGCQPHHRPSATTIAIRIDTS
jgi:hypothetical protein